MEEVIPISIKFDNPFLHDPVYNVYDCKIKLDRTVIAKGKLKYKCDYWKRGINYKFTKTYISESI